MYVCMYGYKGRKPNPNACNVGHVEGLDDIAAFFLVPHECVHIGVLQVGRDGLARGQLEPTPLHTYIILLTFT